MPIQILPPRLANQIAAGEVVERPASVVKELIENSLDAGADQISVEIERGGHQLIRIRDNGCGIPKQELELALSRHATSKVQSLDDLEAIMTLGFRGEALASISSVARLTLASKPATQREGWQAYAEGRDMQVRLEPCSHPDGTTLSVADLFFNTPARRRFLRTEKTEFGHIDEVIRRIALSRFDLQLQLKHNGKAVRQFRACTTAEQQQRRVAAIYGRRFVEQSVHIDSEHQGLKLSGWLGLPGAARAQADLQYCYVNGRMMRDKLIGHAVRQAYADCLGADQQPAYLLFLQLDPHEVDVNVHPAKHEVRFHQARLVHDFIVHLLSDALAAQSETQWGEDPVEPAASEASVFYQPEPLRSSATTAEPRPSVAAYPAAERYLSRPSAAQLQGYQQLLQSAEPLAAVEPESQQARLLTLLDERWLLLQRQQQLRALELCQLLQQQTRACLEAYQRQQAVSQPLLIPLRLTLPAEQCQALAAQSEALAALGIQLSVSASQHVVLKQVPAPLRQSDWTQLLTRLAEQPPEQWLSLCVEATPLQALNYSQVQHLLAQHGGADRFWSAARELPVQQWLAAQ